MDETSTSLALLTPNIQSGSAGRRNAAKLPRRRYRGVGPWSRDTDNEWNLDGATMNIGFYNWNSFNPSIDAIQEFKITDRRLFSPSSDFSPARTSTS